MGKDEREVMNTDTGEGGTMGKLGVAELLGMIAKHDSLQQKRAQLQAGLAERSKEEAALASAWARAGQAVQESDDRVRALRALGDHEGAAGLDAETHAARKSADGAAKALDKHRAETQRTHAEILKAQEEAEALARTITASLKGVGDREALGRIDGYLTDISKSAAEAVERTWGPIEAELRAVRPVLGWWERANGRANPWVTAIVAGRSVTARRCLDEAAGLPAGEVFGRRKR